jgi:hypothetical protein
MRKHLYLITEHKEEDRVGLISAMDSRMSRPLKNEEGPITVLDEEKQGFRDVGKKVGMGYADFEDEEEMEERFPEVIKDKLADLDERWLRKAGHEDKIPEATA